MERPDLGVAETPVEDLVQVLVVTVELGIAGRRQVGKDPVPAQQQQQGLVRPGPVGAAGQRKDRLGRDRASRRLGQLRRHQGVDDERAADGDGGADGGPHQRRLLGEDRQLRHVDGGRQDGDRQDDVERVAVAAGERLAQRHHGAVIQTGRAPVLRVHEAAVDRGQEKPGITRPMGGDEVGQAGARRHRPPPAGAALGGQRIGPEIGQDLRLEARCKPAAGVFHRPCKGLSGL